MNIGLAGLTFPSSIFDLDAGKRIPRALRVRVSLKAALTRKPSLWIDRSSIPKTRNMRLVFVHLVIGSSSVKILTWNPIWHLLWFLRPNERKKGKFP